MGSGLLITIFTSYDSLPLSFQEIPILPFHLVQSRGTIDLALVEFEVKGMETVGEEVEWLQCTFLLLLPALPSTPK